MRAYQMGELDAIIDYNKSCMESTNNERRQQYKVICWR